MNLKNHNRAHDQQADNASRQGERGAALLIVILLSATMSLIALSISERTTLSAVQSTNFRARSEALWYGFGAQAIAMRGLRDIVVASEGVMSRDAAWAREPATLPIEGGLVEIFFADATVCFNINWLGDGEPPEPGAPTDGEREFTRLMELLGLPERDGERIAGIIRDWIDEDDQRGLFGAEDEVYTLKPSPYRTAGGPVTSVSEVRALDGISRDLYLTLKPFLCALPSNTPSIMNINMLTPERAALLAAALGEEITLRQALAFITRRPAGGYQTLEAFLSDEMATELEISPEVRNRFALDSGFMRARAEIVYNDALVEMTMDLTVGADGEVEMRARRLGAEE